MTLRGVIQGLVHGSGDAEAALAENGYGDLPAEMFGQALSSYADTAPMEEADALSPILTTIDAGHASDAFAVFEEQPPTVEAPTDMSGVGASVLGADALDEGIDLFDDNFGEPVSESAESAEAEIAPGTDELDEIDEAPDGQGLFDQPEELDLEPSFDEDAGTDSAGEFEALEDFFDTEPTATGDDPSDLDF